MKKIGVVTATRAEYGLLRPVVVELRKLEKDNDCKVDLIVTGTHLAEEYGSTIQEIEEDGLQIDYRVKIPIESSSENDIAKNQSAALVEFTKLFSEKSYNGVLLLGDRYELLMIAVAAMNTHTPIFHMCGGDTTEGAIDESIRHSITKMSIVHFPTNEVSRKRIIQLGENPSRVYNYGATSVDNIVKLDRLSKQDALKSINMNECKYALCTYHPVTLDNTDIEKMTRDFLAALECFPQLQFIITKSNADQGGTFINRILDDEAARRDNIHVFSSLGVKRYLSLMSYSEAVIGNSSSGIIETVVYKVPAVNIGDRQRGRLQAGNIVNCGSDKDSIVSAIEVALSDNFRELCKGIKNPYGDGDAAKKISRKVMELISNPIDLKKSFYDLHIEA